MILLRNPIGPLPAAIRAALSKVTMLAMMGVDALVPPATWTLPPSTTEILSPMAEMSG